MKKILLVGFYGCGNLGDDALLFALLSRYKREEYHVTVTMGREKLHGFSLPCEIKAVYRKGFSMICSLLRSDNVIFGGGSLLQNTTGQASLCYYLFLILLSKLFHKRVYLISAGLGPIRGKFSRRLCGKIVSLCDGITLRDRRAIALAEEIGVKGCAYARDLAYGICSTGHSISLPTRYILVIPRWKTGISSKIFANEIYRKALRHRASPVLADFFPLEDAEYTMAISGHLSSLGLLPCILPRLSPSEMLSVVKNAVFVLSMRYHGAVFASSMGVPFRIYGNDPKLLAIEEER